MRSRLTVLDTVYWQGEGEPQAAESRFGRWLACGDAPFVRGLRVGERWQPIDPGHVAAASAILVVNDGGEVSPVNLTPEQEAEDAAKVLELGVYPPGHWELQKVEPVIVSPIPPGESARLPNPPLSQLAIRCRRGQTRCTVYLFPE